MVRLFLSWKVWALLLAGATLIGLAEAAQLYVGLQATQRPIAWTRAMAATIPSWFVLVLLMPPVFLL
ncbi:MAG: hypothetical protein ACRELX_07495, partial [Longimicrobiales bacterium]